jgi:hypothetical protein
MPNPVRRSRQETKCCHFCGSERLLMCVLRNAFLHTGELLLGRFGLVAGFPLILRHAVDKLASLRFAHLAVGFCDPVSEAVATKAGQPHQIDILCVSTVL